MSEEKDQEQQEQQEKEDRTKKNPDAGTNKAATNDQVEREEETGGALPQNHSEES